MDPALFVYAIVGAIAGFLAGLLGIGGGLLIVPALILCFNICFIEQSIIMHLALGTSMACIVFTSLVGCLEQQKRGAVLWGVVKKSILGLLIGTFIGTYLATQLATESLKLFFVIFLYTVSVRMMISNIGKTFHQLPGNYTIFGVSSLVGFLSSLVGIGGGTLSVPLMLFCNIKIHNAVATSTAMGFFIAMSGAMGYILFGIGVSTLPSSALGYIYIPALITITCTGAIMAPVGVNISHKLPVDMLRRIFAILLMVVATKMLLTLF